VGWMKVAEGFLLVFGGFASDFCDGWGEGEV
jgi:hypothetical protein